VTNARKHAKANLIEMSLNIQDQWIMLNIADDGVGLPDATHGEGFGMRLLQYRANMLHGKLIVQRRSAGGTTVTCMAPNRA
jgi:signal transduction histidine kinase